MYAINEKKAFCDDADGQLIILNLDTGAYYAFNPLASAVIHDLVAGYEPATIRQALERLAPMADVEAQFSELIGSMLEKELFVPDPGAQIPKDSMSPYAESLLEGGFSLHMDEFLDVADLLLMDPIHEVDPDVGWPQPKPEEKDA